jgi:hypothetical protein
MIFNPGWGSTISINNATSATAAAALPVDADVLVLTNTSTSAISYAYVTQFQSAAETQTGVTPTATNALPILPGGQIIIGCQMGQKVIRTIASAADGALIVTPGRRS